MSLLTDKEWDDSSNERELLNAKLNEYMTYQGKCWILESSRV